MHNGSADLPKNIVILGGSFAGLGSAHYLLRHVIQFLPHHRIVLVSPNLEFLWRPACPRAACRQEFAEDARLFVKIEDALKQYPNDRYQLIQGTATHVDCDNRVVKVRHTNGGDDELGYDALIIATGATTSSPLLGLTGDEGLLREAWKVFRQAMNSAGHIVIAGGGPAGVELAGEIGELLHGRASTTAGGNAEKRAKISLITAGPQILPLLRPYIASAAERALADVGVDVVKETRIVSVSPENAGTAGAVASKCTLHLDNGSVLSADLYIPATGTTPNTSFMDPSLLAPDGRIKVDPSTLRVDCDSPRIYAVGDVSTFARPAVHNILDGVPVACANLKTDLLANKANSTVGADRNFVEDVRTSQFVPIGRYRGVGEVMGWRLPSFLVSWVKGKSYLLWASGWIVSGTQWKKA